MPSSAIQNFQYTARSYRVVMVGRDGTREVVSRHDSFPAAERARKLICSEEGVEIRIETARR